MWYKVKKIYVGTNLVRPVWKPNTNTIVYLPLNSTNTKNDIEWHTTAQWWTVRYWTYWGVDCADFTSWWYVTISSISFPAEWTLVVWANNINGNNASWWYWWAVFWTKSDNTSLKNPWLYYWDSSSSNWYFWFEPDTYFNVNTKSKWYMLAIRMSSSTKKGYLFWESSYKEIDISQSTVLSATWLWYLWWRTDRNDRLFYWYISQFIIENRLWSIQDLTDMFNSMKKWYWY